MRVQFNAVLKDVTRKGTKIQTDEYLTEGKFPIIDQGNNDIAGYRDDETGLFTDVPAIVFGDHTRIVKYITEPFFLGADGVKVLVPIDRTMNCKYLYYQLLSAKIPDTGYNRHFKWVKELEFQLPSRNEQDDVVKRLDKLCVVISARQQQLAKLDELVKARFIEMFGDPVSNQKEWKLVPLGKRCKIITGNTPSRAELENYGEFIEWIKSDNINTPFMFITKAKECLSKTGFEKCRFAEAGSLLMTCIAGSINCIGNVAVTDRRVAFNQQINAIVPAKDKVVYLYWLMMLSKPVINRTINMSLKGILSKRQLAEMEFPFPPLDLQEKFEGLVEKVNKSRRFIQKSLEQMEILKKVLMQKYFG